MKRKNPPRPKCVCSHRYADHFIFKRVGRGFQKAFPSDCRVTGYVDDRGHVEKCPCKYYQPSDAPGAMSNAPYKRSGDLKGPRQMLSAPWAGADSPQRLRPIKNPGKEATLKEGQGWWETTYYPYGGAFRRFKKDYPITLTGNTHPKKGIEFEIIVEGKKLEGWTSKDGILENPRKRKNPAAPGKLIGPRCILIRTNAEEMKINTAAPIYGLKDGSVFIKGFFPRAPRGNVTRIEYMDDAKAAREGLRAKNVPWRHDFTAEKKPISKVRGGLLIRAGKRPLWGMR